MAISDISPYVPRLNEWLKDTPYKAKARSMMTLAVKTIGKGEYRKKPILGSEEVTVRGCRMGRRGKVIFEATIDPPHKDFYEIEFTLEEARKLLGEGLMDFVEDFAKELNGALEAEANGTLDEPRPTTRPMEYGSW